MRNLWSYCFDENLIKYGYANTGNRHVLTDWQGYSDSIYNKKNAGDLSVAFFCGPEPENDVNHLLSLGVRIENIYAFEYDKNTFCNAVQSLRGTYPNLKIFNGKIDTFAELRSVTFDIIYLDFTKSLISEFKTVCYLIDNNALTEQSVLVVNTTYPDMTDENIDFLADYFIFQSCFEYKVLFGDTEGEDIEEDDAVGRFVESCFAYGYYSADDIKPLIKRNFEEAYSAFQTHFIITYGSLIKPIYSVMNNSILRKRVFVSDDNDLKNNAETYSNEEDIVLDPDNHSLLFMVEFMTNQPWKDFFNKKDSGGLYSRLDSVRLLDMYKSSTYSKYFNLLSKPILNEISTINENLIGAKDGLFCDIPMIHLWLELIVNQLGYPYHSNIQNHKRYCYTAKTRKMCLDIYTFDRCRSLYDWLPMIEYYGNDLSIVERQMITRMCIDAIGKHVIWILPELYFGSALVGVNERDWSDNHDIPNRKKII